MAVIPLGLTFAVRRISRPLHANHGKIAQAFGFVSPRSLSTLEISKNITLISNEKLASSVKELRLMPPQEKPLVVVLSWLLSKDKHVNKYAQVYLERGCHVLNVSVTPWQILWPTKGTQLVAGDVLKFLDVNFAYSPLLLHGFSVGAYLWGEVMVKMAAELPKYQPIIDKVVGQVWDSAADITEIPVGFPMAVFPNNNVLQSTLRQYITYHMKTFDKVATCHYLRSSQMFHTNMIRAPALMFLSKTDPIGAERSNQRVRESWESMGMRVGWKCWDKSPHVGHFNKHREEYLSELNGFLDKVLMSGATAQPLAQAI